MAKDVPWPASGQAIIGVLRGRGRLTAPDLQLPPGVRPLPGPAVVLAERVVESPVGPYLTLGVARPARVGIRPGMCFTMMAVDIRDRLSVGRRRFGLPGERAPLCWGTWGEESALVWEERGIEVRGWARGRSFPFRVPGRVLQRRADGPVLVPLSLGGRARRARVEVVVGERDPLAALAGRYPGVVASDVNTLLLPARHPSGLLSSLPAASPAAEPGWSAVEATPIATGAGRS